MASSDDMGVRTTRPALDVLDRDQNRLLYDGDDRRTPQIRPLGDGFETYWLLLAWYQAAGVRTLGHVESVLKPSDIMPESTVVEHLLTPLESSESPYVRRRLVEQLDDACDLAYRQFRERANERVGNPAEEETYHDVDPEKEENPLMRPAFKRLDRGQAASLIDLWQGFEDREDLGRWVRSLATVTNGEKPDHLLDSIVASPPLLEALLDETDRSRLTRYRFAVDVVLPSFLAAARTLNGGEHTEGHTTSHGAFKS